MEEKSMPLMRVALQLYIYLINRRLLGDRLERQRPATAQRNAIASTAFLYLRIFGSLNFSVIKSSAESPVCSIHCFIIHFRFDKWLGQITSREGCAYLLISTLFSGRERTD